jgi:tRNA A-37 threonylcarbamoyl transferase component Bud32
LADVPQPERSLNFPDLTAEVERPSPPAHLQVGQVFTADSGARYEIMAELGHGGMAGVYRARAKKPTGIELEVALKGHLESREGYEAENLLVAEACLGARLEHPNITRAIDLERIGGRLYLVLDYVDGVSLRTVIGAARERKAPVSPEFVCYVGAAVAEALHHANTLPGEDGQPLGIVHRDLTASNVMVTRQGVPKLLDFGIAFARLANRDRTRTGVIRGTYSYMSPEQATAGSAAKGEVDGRSDLFSLGLLLVELLTGQRVFEAEDAWMTIQAIQDCSPARVQEATRELPADLQRICRRLLMRRPDDRYPNGDELGFDLRTALAAREPLYGKRDCVAELAALGLFQLREGETARATTARTAHGTEKRRSAVLVLAALVLGAGAGALGARYLTQAQPPTAPVAPAEAAPVSPPQAQPKAAEPATAQARPDPVPVTAAPAVAAADVGPATSLPSAPTQDWPGGSPVRKKKPDKKGKPSIPAATPEAPAAGEEQGRTTGPRPGPLLQPADRDLVNNASATLPRGMVMRVRLAAAIIAAPGEAVEALVVEDAGTESAGVPKGAVVSCRTGSLSAGRLALFCERAKAGDRVWTFSALALGDGDRTGLRVEGGAVPAGTRFSVAVTASAVLE